MIYLYGIFVRQIPTKIKIYHNKRNEKTLSSALICILLMALFFSGSLKLIKEDINLDNMVDLKDAILSAKNLVFESQKITSDTFKTAFQNYVTSIKIISGLSKPCKLKDNSANLYHPDQIFLMSYLILNVPISYQVILEENVLNFVSFHSPPDHRPPIYLS